MDIKDKSEFPSALLLREKVLENKLTKACFLDSCASTTIVLNLFISIVYNSTCFYSLS